MPIQQQNSTFIDPQNCGSMVAYRIWVDEYTDTKNKTIYTQYGEIVVTDCSRKIDWGFQGDDLDKIDAAIVMLQEFRKKYAGMIKYVKQLNA
jgi:hypothetical protein